MKAPRQDRLDTMDLNANMACRDAHDFADRRCVEVFEWQQDMRIRTPLPDDIRRRGIVRDTIYPGAQRRSTFEFVKAPPQGEVNLLQQIATFIRIQLISPDQPFDRSA